MLILCGVEQILVMESLDGLIGIFDGGSEEKEERDPYHHA
jgi:hypothetical protein